MLVPLPVMETALKRIDINKDMNPISAMNRARVDEKSEIMRTKVIGLMRYQGNEPGPPGLPSNAKFGPLPCNRKPESIKNLLGLMINSKLQGAQIRIGVKVKAKRRYKRALNKTILIPLLLAM